MNYDAGTCSHTRLQWEISTATASPTWRWQTTYDNTVSVLLNTTAFSEPAIVESPSPKSLLTGSSVTFQWDASDPATAFWIDVGLVAGGNQYYQSGEPTHELRGQPR